MADESPVGSALVDGLRQQLHLDVLPGRLVNKSKPIIPDVTKYVINSRLREGAFGAVYLCDVVGSPGKQVVAKVMENADANEATMFLVKMEVNCAMRVKHFACVELLEAFTIEDGVVVLIMEFMSGGSLGRKLRYACNAEIFPLQEEVETSLCSLLLALYHIHALNLVHRDIKPRNILLNEHGMLKLSDFGCGKVIHDDVQTRNWAAVTDIGTREIFAPERCSGCGYGPPADVWSLGVVLYKLIELSPPFDLSCIGGGEEMYDSDSDDVGDGFREVVDPSDEPNPYAADLSAVILHHKIRRMTSNGNVSNDLKAIILSMLEKHPSHRPTVAQMLRMPLVQSMMMRFQTTVESFDQVDLSLRREMVRSIQESLLQAQSPEHPRLAPVQIGGEVVLMGASDWKRYVLSVEPATSSAEATTVFGTDGSTTSGVDFTLHPIPSANTLDAPNAVYRCNLKECCVTLASPTFFVLRTPKSNHTICTATAVDWVRLLNGYTGDVYYTHRENAEE